MAKQQSHNTSKEEKMLNTISQFEIDKQIDFYKKVKDLVSENIYLHQQKLESESNKYQSELDRINNTN